MRNVIYPTSYFQGITGTLNAVERSEIAMMKGRVSHLDLVSECTRGEPAGDGSGASGRGELEHGSLSIGAGRDDTNVSWVLYGGNGTRR